jgi:hypothetical protein
MVMAHALSITHYVLSAYQFYGLARIASSVIGRGVVAITTYSIFASCFLSSCTTAVLQV